MTMPRILLHIGLEKTGTTSIQRFLTANRARLLERHGVLYPTTPGIFHQDSHAALTAALLAPADREFVGGVQVPHIPQVMNELQRSVDLAPRLIVLSSEHLSSRLGATAVAQLAQLLCLFEVKVLVYLRRQDEMAVSAFSTELRTGRRTWLLPHEVGPENGYFNYARLLDPWAAIFGREAIEVRTFDRRTLREGDIVADFLDYLDIDDSGLVRGAQHLNASLNLAEASLMRMINQRLPTWEEAYRRGRPEDFGRAQRLRARILRETRSIGALRHSPPMSSIFSQQDRQRIMRRFQETNAAVARQYLGRDRLFEDSPPREASDGQRVHASWLPDERQLAEILLSFAARIQELESTPLSHRIARKTMSLLRRREAATLGHQH